MIEDWTKIDPTEIQRDAWIDHDFFDDWTEPFEIDGVKLVMTCGACPEQYDAFIGEDRAAYLRLRWGHFTVEAPDVGGKLIYEHDLGDSLSGCFPPEQRKIHLPAAVKALLKWRSENEPSKEPEA